MNNLLLAAQQQVKKSFAENGKRTFVLKVENYELDSRSPLEAQTIVGIRADNGARVRVTQEAFNAAEDKRNTAFILSGKSARSCPIGGYLCVEAKHTKGDHVVANYFRTLSGGDNDPLRGFIVGRATCSTPFKMKSHGIEKMGCRIQVLSNDVHNVSTAEQLDQVAASILTGNRPAGFSPFSERGIAIRSGDLLAPMLVRIPKVKQQSGDYTDMNVKELSDYMRSNMQYQAVRNALANSNGESSVEVVPTQSFIGLQMADGDGYKRMRSAMYHDYFDTVDIKTGEQVVAKAAGYRQSIISIRTMEGKSNFWFATGISPTLSDQLSMSGAESCLPLDYDRKVEMGIIEGRVSTAVGQQPQAPIQSTQPAYQPAPQPINPPSQPVAQVPVDEADSLEALFNDAPASGELDDLLGAAAEEFAEQNNNGMNI